MPITYFDAICQLGRHVHMPPEQPETPEQILAAMDHFGIHEALVVDSLSASTDPRSGNRRILERVRDYPRLHPAWAGLLTHSRELAAPEELVAQMRESGVGALYLFYGEYLLPLEDWAVDDLLAALCEARVPVILSPISLTQGANDITDWRNVVRICRGFPELPVIVTEERIYRSQRTLYEALATCPNLRVDLAAVWLHERVEFICREFGAQQLVWGSHLPYRTPGSPLMQLNYSDISEEELALVAGGNMRQMMSWNPNITFCDEVAFSEPTDTLHETVRERLPLRQERFYDCHGHVGWSTPYHVINDGPADMVEEMDKFGVDVCCVFSMQVLGDVTYGNDETAAMVNAYPSRFIPFTMVHLFHGEERVLEELERGLAWGSQGVKLINAYQNYPTEGPLVDVAVRFAHERGQFILNHDWGSPAQILRLCTTYPDACFFAGHSRGDYVEVTKQVDNLFICTCPFLGWNQTEQYVAMYGADKILFGSDLTDLPIAWGMGQIMYARISEANKRKILGENLLGLMDRYGIKPRGWEG